MQSSNRRKSLSTVSMLILLAQLCCVVLGKGGGRGGSTTSSHGRGGSTSSGGKAHSMAVRGSKSAAFTSSSNSAVYSGSNSSYDFDGNGERTYSGVLFLLLVLFLVPCFCCILPSLFSFIQTARERAHRDLSCHGQHAKCTRSKRKQNAWEKLCEDAKQGVLEDAKKAQPDNPQVPTTSFTEATFSASYSDSTYDGNQMESSGTVKFHTVPAAVDVADDNDMLRERLRSMTGYGRDKDGSFIIVEGLASVWSGKAFWIEEPNNGNGVRCLVSGFFTRQDRTSAGVLFNGSFTCSNGATGSFSRFSLTPKDVEKATGLGIEAPSTDEDIEKDDCEGAGTTDTTSSASDGSGSRDPTNLENGHHDNSPFPFVSKHVSGTLDTVRVWLGLGHHHQRATSGN